MHDTAALSLINFADIFQVQGMLLGVEMSGIVNSIAPSYLSLCHRIQMSWQALEEAVQYCTSHYGSDPI
jgi:hypothetical protein